VKASGVVVVAVIGLCAFGCAQRSVQSAANHSIRDSVRPQASDGMRTPAARDDHDGVEALDLDPVFFEYDAWTLSESGRRALDRCARMMRERQALGVTIEGHCDERGTSEYNFSLGQRRAETARDYLVAAGIAAARIQVVSYGKERPFDIGHDERAWALNRRAHLVSAGVATP